MRLTVVSGDGRVLDPEQPLLHADELAALRGDGIFETLLIRGGRACLLDSHLARLADGAAALALLAPDREQLIRAMAVAVEHWRSTAGSADAVARISYSRGRESEPGGPPTCYLTVGDVPARVGAARRDGITAVTLPRGLAIDTPAEAPWLLAGIKALAYAGNMAALREAARRGADDAILLAPDGAVLESPRASVVIVVDGELRTPPRSGPILPGTTQAALFAQAAAAGIPTREATLFVDDLRGADGVWLVSSVTLAARVRELDGQPLQVGSLGVDVAALIDAAIGD